MVVGVQKVALERMEARQAELENMLAETNRKLRCGTPHMRHTHTASKNT